MKTEHDDNISGVMPFQSNTASKLASHRKLFVAEGISDVLAAQLCAMMMYFDRTSDEPIELYIHSDGGSGAALIQIYDMMQLVSAPIKTICIGKCYSAGAVILAAGTPGYRFALKNSSIMIHGVQALFPIPGYDVNTSKEYMNFLRYSNTVVMKMLADHTGHALDKVERDCKEDVWMTAKQSLQYGLIDRILS